MGDKYNSAFCRGHPFERRKIPGKELTLENGDKPSKERD
jgi:hypothetical protein